MTALHYIKQSLNRWRIDITDRTAGIHYYQPEGQLLPVVVFKSCSDVSDLCHEIAINGYQEHLHLTIWLYVAITELFV